MDKRFFLGISLEDWEVINSFSNWLSAIGTLAAVIVSLWLAGRAGKLRGKAGVGHRLIITPGERGKTPEVISFRIVNTGDRPMVVTGIGWRIGFGGRRYAIQMYDHLQSSKLPVELSHGQEAQWLVPINVKGDSESWIKDFANTMLMPNWRISCFTMRAQFSTSVGETFTVKPEQSLLKLVRKECETLARAGS